MFSALEPHLQQILEIIMMTTIISPFMEHVLLESNVLGALDIY